MPIFQVNLIAEMTFNIEAIDQDDAIDQAYELIYHVSDDVQWDCNEVIEMDDE